MDEQYLLKPEEINKKVCSHCGFMEDVEDECELCTANIADAQAALIDKLRRLGWKSGEDCANCLKVDGTTKEQIQLEVADARSAALKEVFEEIEQWLPYSTGDSPWMTPWYQDLKSRMMEGK